MDAIGGLDEVLRRILHAVDRVFEVTEARLGVLERDRGGDLAGADHRRENRQRLFVVGDVGVGKWLAEEIPQ